MLSRLTNAVLMLAVIVLSSALLRTSRTTEQSQSAPSPAASPFADGAAAVDLNDDMLLLAGAFTPLEPQDLNGAVPGPLDRGGPIRESRDGPRGGDRRWSGSGGGIGPLTDDMADRCIEIAREVDPEIAARLAEARKTEPDEFDRQMRSGSFGRRLLALAQLKTHDPILYGQKISELSSAVQIDRTARQLRDLKNDPAASPGKIEELETNLRSLLQIQLAMSIKSRGDLICRFEERMQHMKDDLDRDVRNFQSTIDARMKLLLESPQQDDSQPAAPANPQPAPNAG